MMLFMGFSIARQFNASYFASFFNINFFFLALYYLVTGLGGVYYVATISKAKVYVFPSDLLRKLMFMFGPIQAPLSIVGVLAYWIVRQTSGANNRLAIFTHGVSLILGGTSKLGSSSLVVSKS